MTSREDFIARASTVVDADAHSVWEALVDPAAITQYMFGTKVETDWSEGGPIVWKGEWEGTPYEDKGAVLRLEPERLLQYSHFSPLSGLPDEPENYHTVTVELEQEARGTRVTLTQDGNATEEAREHSQENWTGMLEGLRRYVELQRRGAA
jgi:uncharacterized protein YndB with AHSA1/START domain